MLHSKDFSSLASPTPSVGEVWLEKKHAIDFLFLLSRADPPVISPARTKQFFRDAGRVISVTPKPDRRAQARQAAFGWMRALLQKEISLDALRRKVGDRIILLDRLYSGRLSDRNRSMAIFGSRRGLSSDTVCSFLGIDRKTYRKYLRTFETGRQDALFARRIKHGQKI